MRFSTLIFFVGALAAALVCGCGGGQSRAQTSAEATDAWRSQLESELGPRAAFEMKCSADKLDFTCLNSHCHEVGVAGCGQRAVYLFTRSSASPQGLWVLNSATTRR